jgi:hypothetical protein
VSVARHAKLHLHQSAALVGVVMTATIWPLAGRFLAPTPETKRVAPDGNGSQQRVRTRQPQRPARPLRARSSATAGLLPCQQASYSGSLRRSGSSRTSLSASPRSWGMREPRRRPARCPLRGSRAPAARELARASRPPFGRSGQFRDASLRRRASRADLEHADIADRLRSLRARHRQSRIAAADHRAGGVRGGRHSPGRRAGDRDHQAVFAFAPFAFGMLHDLTGSYALPFSAAAVFELEAGVIVLTGRAMLNPLRGGSRPPWVHKNIT